ncbi:hypothetical protein B0T22DRAFT_453364 [Podospora appendiculata]|uniref:Uncharacterized protein n=1 Tax=Podospora appendiculata TaxID=314037 RepID=A0AAE0XJU1_9PEZI|nr:hypothetical protein B0T22DRAFT_453364 [Podospora appendiculata]
MSCVQKLGGGESANERGSSVTGKFVTGTRRSRTPIPSHNHSSAQVFCLPPQIRAPSRPQQQRPGTVTPLPRYEVRLKPVQAARLRQRHNKASTARTGWTAANEHSTCQVTSIERFQRLSVSPATPASLCFAMDPSGLQNRQSGDQAPRPGGVSEMANSASPHRRNDGQSPPAPGAHHAHQQPALTRSESWVEISSQPSSSSLSSIGDEIVTTGLRVGSSAYHPRRRRLQQQPMPPSCIISQPPVHAGTSSQDEYDETESEEDRVMTSSAEQVNPSTNLPRQQTAVRSAIAADSETDDDDDENATALGRPSSSPTFRPQPNAFSHPPSHLMHRHSTSSAHPYHPYHPSQTRPSMHGRSQTRPHRASPNYMSPSYQADNDAALRASLTTLLSCAAAARGLPKKDDGRVGGASNAGAGAAVLPSSQPMELRLVPESELMAAGPPSGTSGGGPSKAPPRTASNSSAPSAPTSTSSRDPTLTAEKAKRPAATQNKSLRATKKKRTGSSAGIVDGETGSLISPTLLTWVVSAGVVVLVSVVGFGAGYVIGREVGRQEGAMSLSSAGNSSASCGRELVKSTSGGTLRRFRWGSVGKTITT